MVIKPVVPVPYLVAQDSFYDLSEDCVMFVNSYF